MAPIKDVEFLGFQILRGQIRVSTRARKRFVQEVRSRTRRNNGLSMHQVIGNYLDAKFNLEFARLNAGKIIELKLTGGLIRS